MKRVFKREERGKGERSGAEIPLMEIKLIEISFVFDFMLKVRYPPRARSYSLFALLFSSLSPAGASHSQSRQWGSD